jgi:hypothetical protein
MKFKDYQDIYTKVVAHVKHVVSNRDLYLLQVIDKRAGIKHDRIQRLHIYQSTVVITAIFIVDNREFDIDYELQIDNI